MLQSPIFIAVIFLGAKTLQLANSFVLVRLAGTEQGSIIMAESLALVVVLYLLGWTLKRFFPPIIFRLYGALGFPLFILLLVTGALDESWGFVLLVTVFLYLLIFSEAQFLHILSRNKNIPRTVSVLVALLPLVVYYFFPWAEASTPLLFYIVSSIFAYAASYGITQGGRESSPPPVVFAPLFLGFSGAAYYLSMHSGGGGTEDAAFILGFVLAFYSVGAAVLYMNMTAGLRRLTKS